MAEPQPPSLVKLICGMISSRPELLDEMPGTLCRALGPVDLAGEVTDFDFTHYYDAEMGSPLYRRFVAFQRLVDPGCLAEVKHATNAMERELAAATAIPRAPKVGRPINLDPGYVAPSKLVLASMKDFSHRVYLGRGVYAEVTLLFRRGRWESLPWTFPDYACGRYDAFLTEARDRLRRQAARQQETA